MKNKHKISFLALIALFLFWACEERIETAYSEYVPEKITGEDGAVTYNNLTTYPIVGDIVSEAPTHALTGNFRFSIDTVVAPDESTFNYKSFTINNNTGVLTYSNGGELSPGDYVVSVSVGTPAGTAVYNNVFTMTTNDVPVSIQLDNPTVSAGYLEQGVLATVTVNDETGNGEITETSFELIGEATGFDISASGEISKTGEATEGEKLFSVKVTTNLGAKTFNNVISITVGAPPTIELFQQDGTTALTKVTLSPNSTYTTHAPSLAGMTATTWEVLLPAGLASNSASFSADANGSITIAANAGLPTGTYSLGLKATNAGGVSKDFADLLSMVVEERSSVISDDQFSDDATGDPATVYPGKWATYNIDGAVAWTKFSTVKNNTEVRGFQIKNPATSDAVLVHAYDISNVSGEIEVAFGEFVAFGNSNIPDNYDRAFYYGESDASISTGSFVDSEWNTLMAFDNANWLPAPNWNDLPNPAKEHKVTIDTDQIAGNTLYLMWRLLPKPGNSGANGMYAIDYLTVSGKASFAPEEE